MIRGQTIQLKKINGFKSFFLLTALLSFVIMMTLDYDRDYIATALLPLAYMVFIFFIIKNNVYHKGIGIIAVLVFYCFRMCILPVICALGNFYLEPDKETYIDKYNMAIYLMCFEALIVFLSLSYFCTYYEKKTVFYKILPKNKKFSQSIIFIIIAVLTLFVMVILTIYHIDYFHFLFNLDANFMSDEVFSYQKLHFIWYFTDFICTLWRPLLSILLLYVLSRKKRKISYFLIACVALLNVLFMSDRRIYALLVGGFCFSYLTIIVKSDWIKKYILIVFIICIVFTVRYCFYGAVDDGLWMLSRTFQRYFSGPTLSAMALEVNSRIGLHFFDFFKLLFNDYHLFIGLWGRLYLPDYYYPVFGMSVGLWTPMTTGCIRYFSIFFPIVIILLVRYIVKCDYEVRKTDNELYKMIYSYIAVSVSCYMIMYTIELIVYFIFSTALIFRFLIFIDSKKVRINSL
jgi:hypothetical protein